MLAKNKTMVCVDETTDAESLFWVDEVDGKLWQIPSDDLVFEGPINKIRYEDWTNTVVECNNDTASFVTAEMLTACFSNLRTMPTRIFKTKYNNMVYTHSFSCRSIDNQDLAIRFLWSLSFFVHDSFYDKLNNTDDPTNLLPWLEDVRRLPPFRCWPNCSPKNHHRPRPSCIQGARPIQDWTILTAHERSFFLSLSTHPTMFRVGDEIGNKTKRVREHKLSISRMKDCPLYDSTRFPKRLKTEVYTEYEQTLPPTQIRAPRRPCGTNVCDLPEDALNIIMRMAVSDAIATPDTGRAERSVRALAGVNRMFRNQVARQSTFLIQTCQEATNAFIERGDVRPICKMLDVSDPERAPAALRVYIYKQFRCTPYMFEHGSGKLSLLGTKDGVDGLFAKRSNSGLSKEICNARARSPVLAPLDHATKRIKKIVDMVETSTSPHPDSPERLVDFASDAAAHP